jgi:ArsR family transcriptional regulator
MDQSSSNVKSKQAVGALGALAHSHRLELYRLLVQRGPDGLAAGVLADRLDVPPSSLTFHLQQLLHAGLVTQRRMGRQIIYTADYTVMNDLMAYLTENCCGGAVCAPVCSPALSANVGETANEAPARQRRR